LATPTGQVNLWFLSDLRSLRRQQAHLRTDFLTDVDVYSIELQERKVKDVLEEGLEKFHSIEQIFPGPRSTGLELELGAFGAEEELGLAEIRKARSAGNGLQHIRPHGAKVVRLFMVTDGLLRLIASCLDLPALYLMSLRVVERMAIAGGQMLCIVRVIVLV
jgi:hypothetical protein